MHTVLVNVYSDEISFKDRQVTVNYLDVGYQTEIYVLNSTTSPDAQKIMFCRVEVTFIDRDGDKMKVQAQVGQNLLEVAQENGIDLEGRHRLEEKVYSMSCH